MIHTIGIAQCDSYYHKCFGRTFFLWIGPIHCEFSVCINEKPRTREEQQLWREEARKYHESLAANQVAEQSCKAASK